MSALARTPLTRPSPSGGRVPGPGPRPSPDGEDRPVDLVHLARQTFGDKRLETELLRMFARQARQILSAVEAGVGGDANANVPDLLHSLVGSARVIGAGRVARMAERCDAVWRRRPAAAPPTLAEEDLAPLRDAVEAACAFIGDVLGSA